MRTRIISSVGVLLISLNAFAICDHERGERDEFRALCLSIAGVSVGVATYGSILHPLAGLAGIIPGVVAHNQCRIWQEKEQNLARCEQNYNNEQQANLQRQRDALAAAQRRNERISAINTDYNARDEAARNAHRTAVRELMQRYMQQGRNMRDPLVQAELRGDVQRMEGELNANLQRLGEERQREINAVG